MEGLRGFIQENRVAAIGVLAALVLVAVVVALQSMSGGNVVEQPAQPAATQPALPETAAPVPVAPKAAPAIVVPAAEAGRLDPFQPLVAATSGPSAPPPAGGVGLPSGPPVPPFPPAPLPGGPGAPESGPERALPSYTLIGVLFDGRPIAIVGSGKATWIVAVGETFDGRARVVAIDRAASAVTIEIDGARHELRLGGEK